MDRRWGIRAATRADASAIADVERTCFSDPWSAAGIAEMFENETVEALVAIETGPEMRLAGYLFARVIAGEAEILNVAVPKMFRRLGVGDALLVRALERLAERGAESVFLEVRESNEPAKRLYQRRGFRAVGLRADYYRRPAEHALVLRLDIIRHGDLIQFA
jgi:ribosomal-protein-alanine N-acetyltransferase